MLSTSRLFPLDSEPSLGLDLGSSLQTERNQGPVHCLARFTQWDLGVTGACFEGVSPKLVDHGGHLSKFSDHVGRSFFWTVVDDVCHGTPFQPGMADHVHVLAFPVWRGRAVGLFLEPLRHDTVRPVDDNEDESWATGTKHQGRGRKPPNTQGGGAVYGLGVIGALVWYCQQADEPGEYAVAVFKAFVWPVFLVYEAFKSLDRLTTEGGSEGE